MELGIYRHFKGNEYELLAIVEDSGIHEPVAVYRALATGKKWSRPLEMFMSDVDREKYPEVTQEKRFEYLGPLKLHELYVRLSEWIQ